MFRRGFFFRALGAFLLLVLMVVGGFALHKAGMTQGYALGVAAATSAGQLSEGAAQVLPFMYARPYGWGYGPGFHPFGGFGFIFPLFFGLLFFFLLMRLIFRPFWGWGGPHAYGKHSGSAPPWAKDWERHEPKGESKPTENQES